MKKLITLSILTMLCHLSAFSQSDNIQILADLDTDIQGTDGDATMLVSPTGFNILIQKKALNYLTGVADLSLAKFYATYTTADDKLNLGFNVPLTTPYTKRLKFILNPLFEADVKKNFAKLYKDGNWESNIRGGLKITWFPNFRKLATLNFYPSERSNLQILRTKKYKEIEKKLNDEVTARTAYVQLLDKTWTTPNIPTDQKKIGRDTKKKKNEVYEEVGKAEVDYIEKEKAYTWMQNCWVSAWGLFPITEANKYVSPDNSQLFEKTKFKLWEVNLQGTYLRDYVSVGSFYASLGLKYFRNNSANADLMTNVDYGQYSEFPGINPLNLALLETNKAYIGTYDEFMTTNMNVQLVYILPWQNTVIKPGVSVRFEKNWGDYSPANFRIGVPLNIQGKEKPINIELQYRINDIANYTNKVDHKTIKIVGLSLGFPVSLLY